MAKVELKIDGLDQVEQMLGRARLKITASSDALFEAENELREAYFAMHGITFCAVSCEEGTADESKE